MSKAKLKSFLITCPITQELMEIIPVPRGATEAEELTEEDEYILNFDCPSCGGEHETNILDLVYGTD